MREAEIDQERIASLACLALVEVVQHLLGVPGTAGFVGSAAFGGVADDGELLVGGFVAVALLAGPHRVVAGAVENRRHRVVGQVGRNERRLVTFGFCFASPALGMCQTVRPLMIM